MKYLGNILWFLLGGFLISLVYFVVGFLYCVTIIRIPFGLRHFKMVSLSIMPFGKTFKAAK